MKYMLETAKIAVKGLLIATSETSRKEESWKEKKPLSSREYVNNHEQNFSRNKDSKTILMKSQIRNLLLDSEKKR